MHDTRLKSQLSHKSGYGVNGRPLTPEEAEIFSFDPPARPTAEKPKSDQAARLLAKFNGARRLASILKEIGRPKDPASIYKWTYPRSAGGTDGLVPTGAWPDIFLAARYEGVLITPDDIDPRPQNTAHEKEDDDGTLPHSPSQSLRG